MTATRTLVSKPQTSPGRIAEDVGKIGHRPKACWPSRPKVFKQILRLVDRAEGQRRGEETRVRINNLPLVKEITQQEWENATPEIQDEIKKDVVEEKELIAKLKGVKPGNIHLSPEQKALYVISVEVIIYMTTDLLAVY